MPCVPLDRRGKVQLFLNLAFLFLPDSARSASFELIDIYRIFLDRFMTLQRWPINIRALNVNQLIKK